MLRDAVKRQTAAGMEADGYMKRGELVPDALIARMVPDFLAESDSGVTLLLDGFPRTVAQAEMLDETLASSGASLAVVQLDVPEEVLLDRFAGRRVCPSCKRGYHVTTLRPRREGVCDTCGEGLVTREDDAPETARVRLAKYESQTRPLIDFYAARGLLARVDGARDADAVAGDVRRLLA